jgi:hypothetical protein
MEQSSSSVPGAHERALAHARELGAEHGSNAASWVFDGNTSQETYRRILQGIEDGDPEILNSLPAPDLSGQWADEMTADELVKQSLDHAGMLEWAMGGEMFAHVFDELCSTYEDAFITAAHDEVARTATEQVLFACLERGTHDARDITRLCPHCLSGEASR